jgi:hypothetical protein
MDKSVGYKDLYLRRITHADAVSMMMMLGELSKMVVKMLNWNLFVERGNGKHG